MTDAVLMGSLHNYRRWLKDSGFTEMDPKKQRGILGVGDDGKRLSLVGHSIAGQSRSSFSRSELAPMTDLVRLEL